MPDTCICPSSAEEAPTEGWRRYYLNGEARTTRHEAHYPGCPLRSALPEPDPAWFQTRSDWGTNLGEPR